jgi:tripartite-type tricarboxylate transporter receptor subunit TctC
MKNVLRLLLVAAAAGCAPLHAQQYPVKPVLMVVPYPPGGVDVTIRLLMPVVAQELGQPWVIDYRPGAGGQIGMDHVAHAEPDGYTLVGTASNPWVILPAVKKKSPYDPVKDFTPISIVIEGVNLIVAPRSFKPNTLTEMLQFAKQNPGKLAWATSGLGSTWHLDSENIKRLAGVDILHVPFQGFAPMIPAMYSGQVQMGLITYQIIRPLVEAGKFKMIAILNSGTKTKALYPRGVQVVSDVLPGFESSASWVGIGGPAGLPPEVVRRENAAIVKAINQKDLQDRFTRDGIVATGSTPEEFAARVRNDVASSHRIVKEAHIPLLD